MLDLGAVFKNRKVFDVQRMPGDNGPGVERGEEEAAHCVLQRCGGGLQEQSQGLKINLLENIHTHILQAELAKKRKRSRMEDAEDVDEEDDEDAEADADADCTIVSAPAAAAPAPAAASAAPAAAPVAPAAASAAPAAAPVAPAAASAAPAAVSAASAAASAPAPAAPAPTSTKAKPVPKAHTRSAHPKQSLLGVVDRVSEAENKLIDSAWAKAYYCGGIPFSFASSPEFKAAMRATRPTLRRVVDEDAIRGPLLDAAYEEIVLDEITRIKHAARDNGTGISLHADAWESKLKKQHLLSVSICSPEPQLLASHTLTQRSHDGEEYCTALKQIISETGIGQYLTAVLVDAGSAILKGAKDLKDVYPTILILVCVCHALNRLLNDIIGTRTVSKKDTPNVYNAYFVWSNQIVSAVKNTENIRKAVYAIQAASAMVEKVSPVGNNTRWLTIGDSWDWINNNFNTMRTLMNDENETSIHNQMPALQKFGDLAFWEKFMFVRKLVCSTTEAIRYMEQDSARIGHILPMFWALKQVFNACTTPDGEVPGHKKCKKARDEREKYYVDTSHCVLATILSPTCYIPDAEGKVPRGVLGRYLETFDPKSLMDQAEKAVELWADNEEAELELLREISCFLSREAPYHSKMLWCHEKSAPEVFWGIASKLYPNLLLPPRAKKLCSIVPHTAVQERVFSTMGWQSEGRENMDLQRLHKVTAICTTTKRAAKKAKLAQAKK